MTDRTRHEARSTVPPATRTVGTATLVIGLVFVLVSTVALVYGLGHQLPAEAFRFGLPVLLIALGLLGLALNRAPRRPRRHRPARTRATPRG